MHDPDRCLTDVSRNDAARCPIASPAVCPPPPGAVGAEGGFPVSRLRQARRPLVPLDDRGPLRTLFVITSMPVGGAEVLLVNLLRRFDRDAVAPEVCCLKAPGPLGEEIAAEVPLHARLLCNKYDLRVWPRLVGLLRRRRIDAVVTVGAGDKMFWGRLAAWRAGVPVIASALHSTGWPDGVGRLNRLLTPLTDAFIAVAAEHGRFLVEQERFPADRVRVIPNGVDVARFRRDGAAREAVRRELGIPADAPVCGIVAALRPEKNHRMFLDAAARVRQALPEARFLIVGDGPEREGLREYAAALGLADRVLWAGSRSDVPELLSAMDVFALTSLNEASPVSILEAMAVELPVVATRVGSVAESVRDGETGRLIHRDDAAGAAARVIELLAHPPAARRMGAAARRYVIAHASLERMVSGYEALLREIYAAKCRARAG